MKAETLLESARELLRNHRYKSSMGLGMRGLMDHHVEALAPEIAAFAAEREAAARDEEREACCKDVCASCKQGLRVEQSKSRVTSGQWFHLGYTIWCRASAIRARKEG